MQVYFSLTFFFFSFFGSLISTIWEPCLLVIEAVSAVAKFNKSNNIKYVLVYRVVHRFTLNYLIMNCATYSNFFFFSVNLHALSYNTDPTLCRETHSILLYRIHFYPLYQLRGLQACRKKIK